MTITLSNIIIKKKKPEFEPSLHKLWKLWRATSVTMLDAEIVRAEVQPLADLKKLIHYKEKWHNEIEAKCNAPKSTTILFN